MADGINKITELPAPVVFKDYIDAVGLTKDGKRTKSPWQYDDLPEEIRNADPQWYIYNVGPQRHTINAGSMGTHYLFPPKEGENVGKALVIRKYMVDWADQGDYKHKPIIMKGDDVAREWVTPNGEAETDLRKWGVFASKNNPPTDEEVAEAKERLRKTFDALIKYADSLYEQPARRKEITPIYVIAAKTNKVVRPWCSESRAMKSCEGCFSPVEAAAAKCNACGAILDWNKARKLRLVSKAEFEEAVADGLVPEAVTAE
jgi:hypothetical protein